MDWKDPTTWGWFGAALVGFLVTARKYLRTDKVESSAASAIVSINEATSEIIEEMRKNLAALAHEVATLKIRIHDLIEMNKACEERNKHLQKKLLTLADKVTTIKGIDMLDKGEL